MDLTREPSLLKLIRKKRVRPTFTIRDGVVVPYFPRLQPGDVLLADEASRRYVHTNTNVKTMGNQRFQGRVKDFADDMSSCFDVTKDKPYNVVLKVLAFFNLRSGCSEMRIKSALRYDRSVLSSFTRQLNEHSSSRETATEWMQTKRQELGKKDQPEKPASLLVVQSVHSGKLCTTSASDGGGAAFHFEGVPVKASLSGGGNSDSQNEALLLSALTSKFDNNKNDEPFSLVEDRMFASHLGASDEGASDMALFWEDLLTDDALAELRKPDRRRRSHRGCWHEARVGDRSGACRVEAGSSCVVGWTLFDSTGRRFIAYYNGSCRCRPASVVGLVHAEVPEAGCGTAPVGG